MKPEVERWSTVVVVVGVSIGFDDTFFRCFPHYLFFPLFFSNNDELGTSNGS